MVTLKSHLSVSSLRGTGPHFYDWSVVGFLARFVARIKPQGSKAVVLRYRGLMSRELLAADLTCGLCWNFGVGCELMYQFFEDAAAMFVILELIEASAGRSEQDDVAWAGGVFCDFQGAIQRARVVDRDAAGNLAGDFFRGSAYEQSQLRARFEVFA
jgi:hypothetical protein